MALYTFHHLSLAVPQEGLEIAPELGPLLRDLSFVAVPALTQPPSLHLAVYWHEHEVSVPDSAREVFRTDGFRGFACGDNFYLTEGTALLHLQATKGQGIAWLTSAFCTQPLLLRQQFWAVGILKLLRALGLYGLHAAGVVSGTGKGLLIIGRSGSGKSTLAIGMIRQGWRYLSDDAVLLRLHPDGVEALAFRRPFSIDAHAAIGDATLPLGNEGRHLSGKRKRRVEMHTAFPGHYTPYCRPHVLLFVRIVSEAQSVLRPLSCCSALKHLLEQSGPPLFERHTMALHLEVLTRLVRQATPYELQAGRDLFGQSSLLVQLLHDADKGEPWHASSWN
jgi:hypothetical protein